MKIFSIGDRVRLAATRNVWGDNLFVEATGRVVRRFECADATQLFWVRLDKEDESHSKFRTAVASEMTSIEPDSRFTWKQGDIQSSRD